jgi:trehalose 6-phosphate synthase/phosphatase
MAQAELDQLSEAYAGKKIVVGVDRLDYTKGIPEKLVAFEEFLTTYPDLRQKVVLVQVASPSRTGVEEYQQLKRDVDELVGRINGAFGTASHTPVVYLNQHVARERLVGFYAAADVALVTPIRDGMNLVALEYVAARGDTPGTLILSEFTGAAHSMAGARLVNPHDAQAVCSALHDSLTAAEPNAEAFHHMRAFVRQNTSVRWATRFLDRLDKIPDSTSLAAQLLRLDATPLRQKIADVRQPLAILDYDGTLRDFAKEPNAATPERLLLAVLEQLAQVATVYIVSGRRWKTLDRWLGHLPIGLVGEHGVGVRHAGKPWEFCELDSEFLSEDVEPLMRDFVDRTPGSSLERKRAGLTWHYRAVEPEFGLLRATELMAQLESQVSRQPLHVMRGNRVVEVRHEGVSKGKALERLLQRHPEADFLLCAGDDRSDEEMLQAIPANWADRVVRCWVGWRNPIAEYWVESPTALVAQLEALASLLAEPQRSR